MLKEKDIEEIYTLSPTQQGILFQVLLAPNSGVYFDQQLCTLQGKLNISAFASAWQNVVNRQPTLRTGFVWEGLNKPVQIVHRQATIQIIQADWSTLSATEQETYLQDYLQSDRDRGFQLSKPPLMRLALFQIAENVHQLIWSTHHLISDVWSDAILLKKVFALYEAFEQNKGIDLPPTFLYRDYINWLKQLNLTEAENFWKTLLQDFKAPTQLRIDETNVNSSTLTESYGQQEVKFSVELTAALQSLAKQQHFTLNTLFTAAWSLLLSHYSGNNDVLFGTVFSGRPVNLTGFELMVGVFVNTLPTRVKLSPEDFLLPWLKSLHSQKINLHQYEHTPLAQIQNWSNIPKELPLFESILVFQNSKVDISQLSTPKLKIDNVRAFTTTNYPLALTIVPDVNLWLNMSYDLRRFPPATVAKILKHLEIVLRAMVTKPNVQLKTLIEMLNELKKQEKSAALESNRQLNANKLKNIQPKVIKSYSNPI